MKDNIINEHLLICITFAIISISFTGVCQDFALAPCHSVSNLITNPDFESNGGCVTSGFCPTFHIGSCMQNWSIDHGTPHFRIDSCLNRQSNSYIRCVSNAEFGEGVFQLVSLIPDSTYQMCLWVRSFGFPALTTGTVVVSLGSSSPGLPQDGACLGEPFLGVNDIFEQDVINFLNGWSRVEFLFTVPENSNFNRIILRGKGGTLVGFDNISLVKASECRDNWTLTTPGAQINEGIHSYKDFIHIESSDPDAAPITHVTDEDVVLEAGNCIRIKPGFNSSINGSYSAIFRLKGCSFAINESCCMPPPCFLDNSGRTFTETDQSYDNNVGQKSWQTNIFPNPASGNNLHISSNERITEVFVYDGFGKLMYLSGGDVRKLDISSFTKGIYILRVINVDGEILTNKFIKD